ncbi:MAG: sialate O-acetylesterase [Bacteroidales bacterium]|nr:sialate O-acetylesterase [Bacteroidales bacterium]
MNLRRIFSAGILFLSVSLLTLSAKITLPPQIGDNMVLQRNTSAGIWGWADPGAAVKVTTSWNGQEYSAKADKDGKWKVKVSTPEGSYTEYAVTISSGKEKITLSHVLVGEVWLGSGQSNMKMPLKGFDGCPVEGALQEIVQAGRYKGRIRFATLPKIEAYSPLKISDAPWKESTPQNAPMFGAAAWFFAKNLTEVLDVPVGIINNAWGGSCVEGWLPQEIVKEYPGVASDSLECRKIMMAMSRPMIMYYGQWCPIRDYTFKGVIWYQGESNANDSAVFYADRMATLIDLWRKETGNPSLPVYQVEIAPYKQNGTLDGLESAILREQQRLCAERTDNCWIISTNDLVFPYEQTQIHPAKKKEVGERLSYLAFNHTYGLDYFPGAAPSYESMDFEGNSIVLTFDGVQQAGGFNRDSGIEGFEICGPDLQWHKAEASVMPYVGTFTVSSPEVSDPVAVRYSFRNFLPGNLAGANGLAVHPFRTDRLIEGEKPLGKADIPDGDFEGRWTGTGVLAGLDNQPFSVDVTFRKGQDGKWICSIPGKEDQEAFVTGDRISFNGDMGGFSLPMRLKYHKDGSVWAEIMGNPVVELHRQ